MRLIVAVSAIALVAGVAVAKPLTRDAALKLMHDRHERMEQIGKAVKAARPALAAGDMATVRKSSALIANYSRQVPSWFPAGTGPNVGKTMAKPGIWQDPKDFAAKAEDFQKAALAFDAAAKAGDAAQAQAAFGALGKTCKACHEPYRSEHKH